MCNFIIRPIKCYATVDVQGAGGERVVKAGEAVTVVRIQGTDVVIDADKTQAEVPLEVFVHAFSDKDPNAKKEKEAKK